MKTQHHPYHHPSVWRATDLGCKDAISLALSEEIQEGSSTCYTDNARYVESPSPRKD